MAKSSQPITGNIPFRALINRKLDRLDLHVIAAIASFDRMSANRGGAGCWAGTNRLASICAAHPSNVSKSITKLKAEGLLEERATNAKRARGGVALFVIYNELDARSFDAVIATDSWSTDQIAQGDLWSVDQSKSGAQSAANPSGAPIADSKRDVKRNMNRGSRESAPISTGAWLAMLERRLLGGEVISNDETDRLLNIAASAVRGDPDGGRAQRLLDRLD